MLVERNQRSSTVDAAEIRPGLWIGSMPATLDVVRTLHDECGIEALLSLQTNIDLLTLGYDWPQMEALLQQGGITAFERVPIPDFEEQSLALNLDEAIAALGRLHDDRGLTTYVHCTAGVNRAPTVSIAYLMARGGVDLDAAWAEVHAVRQVFPLRSALERWMGNRARSGRPVTPGISNEEEVEPWPSTR